MFQTQASSPKEGNRTPEQCFGMVTNHLNALYLLAAGMLMGPSGFGGKHYTDSLSLFPGWIPLFRFGVPTTVLEASTREASHLRPCIVLIDLTSTRGTCQMSTKSGRWQAMPLGEGTPEDCAAVLLPSPLPLPEPTRLVFRSSEDRQLFLSAAEDVGNLDLSDVQLELKPELFNEDPKQVWPPPDAPFTAQDRAPVRGQSVGGVVAMLYHAANRSAIALSVFRMVLSRQTVQDRDQLARDPLLRQLPRWLDGRADSEQSELQVRLFWGVADAIVSAKAAGSALKPLDATLRFLQGQIESLEDASYRARLEKLVTDMRGTLAFGDSTVTGLLERHRGGFSRALLLLCLCERCEDLLAFNHPLLSEQEFVLACVLSGARDGWIGLSRELKRPASLLRYVSRRMAAAEHALCESEVSFVPSDECPIPLRELFETRDSGWSKKQMGAALAIARDHKWTECLRTRIAIGKGEYRLLVESGGVSLILDGEVKAVTTEVDPTAFLAQIATGKIDAKIEASVRETLGKAG